MKQYEAIGVIEAQYFAVAMQLLDEMSKSANIEFITSENYLGGRLVSVIIGGGISDVSAAIEVAKQVCQQKESNPLKMAVVISKPHPEILKYMISSKEEQQVSTEEVPNEALKETTTTEEAGTEISNEEVQPKPRRNVRRKNNE
ncbi:BMC domain-containing protein [Cytobacillus spongiae]|jgi:microcompartment protein CcmL/EutN|uniref:BMC domain-containing protein n=1 Tax=Cytobacillus spongiae TaxID=2901381 RepID=UPI001F424635|nr:BMC domain-containing protein [Cytobacillus spongiae]UII55514.1 BMC domain-containing protein [Cytobacillus spongiae]